MTREREIGIRMLTADDIAEMCDVPIADLSDGVRRLIAESDLSYSPLSGKERDGVILDVLNRLEEPLSVSGTSRRDDWEEGWAENLREFKHHGVDAGLAPRYFNSKRVMRLHGDYILPTHPGFLGRFHAAYCRVLFERYLSDRDGVWEFGCGTGHNLISLTKMFPDKKLVGLDWSRSAIELVDELARQHPNLAGRVFDMFHPDRNIIFGSNDAIITIHALEQLGQDHKPFLDFLVERRPRLCINIEPVIELYDDNHDLLDNLATRYHRKRGYLEGYLTALRKLEAEGRIELLKVKRSRFGSTFDEGYSLLVWRPR